MPRSSKRVGFYSSSPIAVATTMSAVYLAVTPTNILSETAIKISSFANLHPGWDYGRGGPIREAARNLGLGWNNFFRSIGFVETDAFPGGDGELVIAAGNEDHYFEIIIEPDVTVSLAYDLKGKQAFYRPNMSSFEAEQTILHIMGRPQWMSFGYSTQTNTIRNGVNLHVQHFGTQKTTAYSPLSALTALINPAPPSAPISGSTINNSQASSGNPQFFGDLHPTYFQRGTA